MSRRKSTIMDTFNRDSVAVVQSRAGMGIYPCRQLLVWASPMPAMSDQRLYALGGRP